MKLRPQGGLGDAIFTVPLVAAYVLYDIHVTVQTKYPEVFKPFGLRVTTEPLSTASGYTELRYRRFGPPYFKTYFPENAPASFGAALMFARAIYGQRAQESWLSEFPNESYCVYAPPRAAERHKIFKIPEYQFQCAPNVASANAVLPRDMMICYVGQNEKFCPEVGIPRGKSGPRFMNFVDSLTLWQLFALVAGSKLIVSQVSAITAIAGLFDIQTKFLKGRNDTDEQHARHVAGMLWEK